MRIARAILIIGIIISGISMVGILWCYLYKGTLNKSSKVKNKKLTVENKEIISKENKEQKDESDEGTELLEEEEGTALLEDSDDTQLLD